MSLSVLPSSNIRSSSDEVATFHDYISFFQKILKPKRCLLTDELYSYDSVKEQWESVFNRKNLNVLKSYATETEGFIKKSHLESHLYRYQETKEPELLIELPFWDGIDRIRTIANCITATNLTKEQIYEVLCQWGSKLWERVQDPKVTNEVIIWIGGQGLGKSVLESALTDYLGLYSNYLTVDSSETEMWSQLSQSICVRVPEWDRLADKIDNATLKHFITTDFATFRVPYSRRSEKRPIRASFIGSSNIATGLLTDPTGNRRFIPIELEDIEWNYPVNESDQVLAQFLELSKERFRVAPATQEAVDQYVKDNSPVDVEKQALAHFDQSIRELEKQFPENDGLFPLPEIESVLTEIEQEFQIRRQNLQKRLNATGRTARSNQRQRYRRLK